MRVLIPIDGSAHSRGAFDVVLSRKWDQSTEFKLITVVTPFDVLAAGFHAAQEHIQMPDESELAARALQDLSKELSSQVTGLVHPPEVHNGMARQAILEAIDDWNADLVVMGSHGRTGIKLALLGSVSQSVLEHAPCPVLMAKSSASTTKGGFKNVVIGLDGSSFSELAVEFVAEQTWRQDAVFRFVNVVPQLPLSYMKVEDVEKANQMLSAYAARKDAIRQELAESVKRVVPGLARKDLVFEVLEGDPREALVSYTTSIDADLVVLGSHGRTGLSRLLIGSVSHAVSTHVPCSVLVVRPPRTESVGAAARRLDTLADSPPFTML